MRDHRPVQHGDTAGERRASIDDLLDRAVFAINSGDRAAATALAGEVLAIDCANTDAEDLLAAPDDTGEMRRLTIVYIDLVESTQLSTRLEPELYRVLVGRYRELVTRTIERYEGHVASTKGDGLLVVFGHPVAHENDVHRAVRAGLDITREVRGLSEQASGGSVSASTFGWACTAGWCTSTSPRTTFTGWARISPRGSARWRRPGPWWFPMSWCR